ncbi:MAG: signal peptidase II [Clostridia bacterium]|nr:signal peptidase II [Clostridia bacterium]
MKKLKVNIGWKSIVLIGVCIALILVDLLTKIFEERYADAWTFKVIPGFIEVEGGAIHRNPGCAFSFLANASWGQGFLIAMTFLLLIALVAVYIFMPERFLILKISLSMIVAGAVGNLIDRIAYLEVRDFVGVRMFGNMVFCNFADFWITFGTALAIIDIMFLNEFALVPLTKKAKAAQAKKKEQENKSNSDTQEINSDKTDTDGNE